MIRVDVLGGFHVAGLGADPASASARPDPHGAALSDGTRRLIAALAIRARPADRGTLASQLWPDALDARAASSLRSAIARLGDGGREIVGSAPGGLMLNDAVAVDLRTARGTAARLLEPRQEEPDDADISPAAVALFSADLLPDWFDAWLEPAAEEWRHLRVNALEAQSQALLTRSRLHEAASAARRAIDVDPLRETAQRCLIAVHVAAGNRSDALRAYEIYRTRLEREVGLEPTEMLTDLVSALRPRVSARRGG
ncbi:AfsR/SARP family transcriptional regulator [Clavibacter michiganensis]|uniref:Transcriptional regulator n=3 Tax=Clavibacter michiganensis TaxID=28447 RepID=A0A0D5CJQ5_9MICO|nr:bacterial transcriptional activator domain-containing protein [Clavibacter michiganensis]AJW79856.1 transcriptional regulator [Clavibacter michiganensis subsp. insidiosus]AWF97524.1 transcriptional regulator [Clavibacter michiganensis subsp. insidiosus]AWG02385.1 transcriptional regulator [Clavibacter michiganensis subsp. insidiosus]OQJ59165.1 transcriptional regulator [Clavibacter michiganensis subsp. insidiosus]RMC83599.1 transcriptional regulator [Clavibacter michiganensis subsp. insidio